jgi:hypothetical protein
LEILTLFSFGFLVAALGDLLEEFLSVFDFGLGWEFGSWI